MLDQNGGYSSSFRGFVGLLQKYVYVSTTGTYCNTGMRLCRTARPALASKLCLCVHIHKPVCTGSCSQTYLFALCNQVKTPTSGSFCFCAAQIQKKGLANSIQRRLWREAKSGIKPRGQTLVWEARAKCVCVFCERVGLSDWWLTVGRPVNTPTGWTTDKWTDGQLLAH